MDKSKVKVIIFLLGSFFWLALFQMEAIPVNEVVTVVLRAPTSKAPQLVVKPSKTEVDQSIRGLTVSLPKNTPVFFYIDQVNTALYTLEIKVTEEESEVAQSPEFKSTSIVSFLPRIEKILKNLVNVQALNGESQKALEDNGTREVLENLRDTVGAVNELNKELDVLLYKPEDPEFYATSAEEIHNSFDQIQIDAAELTKNSLNLEHGTSQDIYNAAKAVFEKFHQTYQNLQVQSSASLPQNLADRFNELANIVPRDLSDTSNEVVVAFRTAAQKLRAIETATWTEYDTETRLLKNKIKYTCVFTPKMENAQVKSLVREVTVQGVTTGWIIKTTQGTFISNFRDDEGDNSQNLTFSLGTLVHLSHSNLKRLSVNWGVSGGFGLDRDKNTQVALGVSCLVKTDEEKVFVLTGGVILGERKPTDSQWGGFGAITFNFNSILGLTLGSNSAGN